MADIVLDEMLYPAGPSVPLAGDRLHGGPDRGELRGRGRRSSRSTTRRPTPASSSPATSTPATHARAGREVVRRRQAGRAGRSRSTIPGVALTGVQKKTITDRVQLPRLYLAWLTPRHFAPGDAALDVVADVLAGGKNSRLYKRLVYDMQIAQDVSAFQAVAGAVVVVPDRSPRRGPGHTVEELQKVIDEEIAEAAARGADRARGRARAQPDRGVVLQPHGARRRIRRQGRSAERATTPSTGDPDWFDEDLARYRALSPSRHPAPPRRSSCRATGASS